MYHDKYCHILFEYFFQSVICRILPAMILSMDVNCWQLAIFQSVICRILPAMILPAISDLQLEGDDLTRPPFYHFTDYLDLLNEWIHALCDIVKEHDNQIIEKRLQKHCSESASLHSFNKGDMYIVIFNLKLLSLTTICHPKSSKCLMLDSCTFSQK